MKSHKIITLLTLAAVILALSGCEYDKSPAVWNEALPPGGNPAITSVEPAGAAFAGYSQVRLTGTNFTADTSQVTVWFGNQRARVIAASSTQLTVIPPAMVGEGLTIQVVVAAAMETARYSPYKLEYVSVEYGGFAALDVIQAMALDREENLYAQMADKSVLRINAAGVSESYGSITFPRAADMKMGPGGYLYLQANLSKDIYRIAPGGGAAVKWVSLPKASGFFDFGVDQKLYAAGNKTGIYIINPDATIKESTLFNEHDVKALRVVQGHIYILAGYLGKDATIPKAGIWRAPIGADGMPGAMQLVLDWATTGDYVAARYFALEFAQDGDIYIATNAEAPILVLHPGGAMEPLYPGLLMKHYTQMEWGNGNYLYANRSSQSGTPRVQRFAMGKPGMPLNGRM